MASWITRRCKLLVVVLVMVIIGYQGRQSLYLKSATFSSPIRGDLNSTLREFAHAQRGNLSALELYHSNRNLTNDTVLIFHGQNNPNTTAANDTTADSFPLIEIADRASYRKSLNGLKVITPYTWTVLIAPNNVCSSDLDVICLVHSRPDHVALRTLIRQSWGDSDNYPWFRVRVKSVFVLGLPERAAQLAAVRKESELHGDILLADFRDHYWNLTHKARTAFRYAATHCAHAQFTLKADDDMFIDIFGATDDLFRIPPSLRFISCFARSAEPLKPYLQNETGDKMFPAYCPGSAISMPSAVARDIDLYASYVKWLRWDDVIVTGYVRKAIGDVALVQNGTKYFVEKDRVRRAKLDTLRKYHFVHHITSERKYKQLWIKTLQEAKRTQA